MSHADSYSITKEYLKVHFPPLKTMATIFCLVLRVGFSDIDQQTDSVGITQQPILTVQLYCTAVLICHSLHKVTYSRTA